MTSSMLIIEEASHPLGGQGHHRALARQAGAGLPEVKGSRAARSCAKPSFPLSKESLWQRLGTAAASVSQDK